MNQESEIPGDTHLVEIENKNDTNEKIQILLIPTPSSDPNDPLNWTKTRKYFHMFCIVVYVFGIGVPTTVIYSVLPDIATHTEISIGDLNAGTGYMFLFLGLGCLLFLPLSLQYGKRPVYLFSSFACCLISVWQPYAGKNGTWIASKVLQGFFASAVEALPEVSVSDVFFEHERATWMGVYAIALFSSNYLAPMIAGFVNDTIGWRWVIYLSCIWNAVAFVFLSLFLEETNYERQLPEVRDPDPSNLLIAEESKNFDKQDLNITVEQVKNEPLFTGSSDVPRMNPTLHTKSLWERMAFQKPSKNFLLWHYIWRSIQMAQFPVVLWSGFLYGASLIWYSVMNATLAVVFGAEPYGFSSAMTGLVYASPLIFAIVFYVYAGWTLDYLKVKIARRRNGYSKSEDRLWSLILYMILGPSALILWGVGAYYRIHWFGLIIGCGIMGGLAPLGCSVGVTYSIDTYHEMSCECMVIVILIRNGMSFAVNYGITPWVTNMGYRDAFITAAFICLFSFSTFLIMVYIGPTLRRKTKDKYWRIVMKKQECF